MNAHGNETRVNYAKPQILDLNLMVPIVGYTCDSGTGANGSGPDCGTGSTAAGGSCGNGGNVISTGSNCAQGGNQLT